MGEIDRVIRFQNTEGGGGGGGGSCCRLVCHGQVAAFN